MDDHLILGKPHFLEGNLSMEHTIGKGHYFASLEKFIFIVTGVEFC